MKLIIEEVESVVSEVEIFEKKLFPVSVFRKLINLNSNVLKFLVTGSEPLFSENR